MVLEHCVPEQKVSLLRDEIAEKIGSVWASQFVEISSHAIGVTVTLGLGWFIHNL